MQTAPVEEVQREVEGLLSRADIQDLQPLVGQLASMLVSRSLADPAFYTPSTLAQLVHTQSLCHRSVRHGHESRMELFISYLMEKSLKGTHFDSQCYHSVFSLYCVLFF